MIAIDTNVIIDIFKKNKDIKKILDKINDNLCCTIINYQEIMFGIDINNKNKEEFYFYESFFNNIDINMIDKTSSIKSSEIHWILKKSGKVIDKFDLIIAGILLSNNINTIITRNKKHFEQIPGLKVLSY